MKHYLTPELQRECIRVLERYYGLVVSVEQLEAVLAKDVDFRRGLIRYSSPSDTADRDALGHLVIKDILGDDAGTGWPTYGDGELYAQQFYEKLRQAAPLKGYTFLG